MTSNHSTDSALMVLALVAEFDHRYQGMDREELENRAAAWAGQLEGRNLDRGDLLEGVRRAYSAAARPPNPVGAIITEARAVKRDRLLKTQTRQRIEESRAIQPPRRRVPKTHLYEVDGAVETVCPTCGAEPGEYCSDNRLGVRRMPHNTRLRKAYRLHHRPDLDPEDVGADGPAATA